MSGKASRSKGIRGEREACEALADVWPGLQRVYGQARANSASPDIDAPGCPVFIEVKRQESINVHAAMAQAIKASDDAWTFKRVPRGGDGPDSCVLMDVASSRPPLVIHKRNRGEWLVTMRASDFVSMMGQRAAKPRCVFNQPGACLNCSEVGEGCAMRRLEGK